MMEQTEILVRRALKAKQISEALSLEIEKRGEDAFQQISAIMKTEMLSDVSKVNALRLLAQITRHAYIEGKLEVIRVTTELARDSSEVVRSRACLVAIAMLETLEHLPRLEQHVDIALNMARTAVADALRAGIDAKTHELAMQVCQARRW